MKEGKSLVELAQELQRQQETKRDFITDTRQLRLITHRPIGVSGQQEDKPRLYQLALNGQGAFNVSDNTHRQIAGHVGIPAKYYERMLSEAPELLINNVHHWFQNQPERRMVRTLDGKARAYLSHRYRRLDNFDLAETVLPVLQEAAGIQIVSTEITERRLYLKAIFPRIEAEVKKGDAVQSGIVITNSEVGASSVRIEPLVYRLVCLNGMIAEDHSLRKYHIGRGADGGEDAYELFADETLKADDKAFWMKVRDTVRAAATSQAAFDRIVDKMRAAAESTQLVDPVKAVEELATRYTMNTGERNGVLKHLLSGGDLSKWGVLNAITATSQEIDDYDRATDFERLGGSVLELPRSDWQKIAEAA